MSTKIPGLKNIPPKTDRELKLALDDIKQALEIRLGLRGDPLDRAVTLRELEDSGIVKVRNKRNTLLTNSDYTQLADSTYPSTQDAWKTYRQQLRDITKGVTDPDTIVFPEEPK